MVRVTNSWASDLRSIPGWVFEFLLIVFYWIHLVRGELWKNWNVSNWTLSQKAIQTISTNSLFVARQNSPITSIDTEVILSPWKEFADTLLVIGPKEMIWIICFGQTGKCVLCIEASVQNFGVNCVRLIEAVDWTFLLYLTQISADLWVNWFQSCLKINRAWPFF